MNMYFPQTIPILSCAEAGAWERRFFDPARGDGCEPVPQVADFMRLAGTRIGEFVLHKLRGNAPGSLLVLVGKGHNGGDSLIAAMTILRAFPDLEITLSLAFFVEKWDDLAPLTMDAYEAILRERGKPRTFFVTESSIGEFTNFLPIGNGVVLDGIYGYGFRPPLKEHVFKALVAVNERSQGSLRIAVDLPSGLCDAEYTHYAFIADYTCAAGIIKKPVFSGRNAIYAGRVIPINLGFPIDDFCILGADTESVLSQIPWSRPVFCDKRDFGHLVIVGGSRDMPGALLLNTLAALRAGAGLVTVLCPKSVHAAFAARAPAAMWVACDEAEDGALGYSDTFEKLQRYIPRANTILCGSGMGTSKNAQMLIQKIAETTPPNVALILDADALRLEMLQKLRKVGENILLPHEGEFLRMKGDINSPQTFCAENDVIIALKGAYTRVVSASGEVIVSFAGTPMLARGGSGDLLAGVVAGLFASREASYEKIAFNANSRLLLLSGVVWHGVAAEKLADAEGERTADISHLPDYLG